MKFIIKQAVLVSSYQNLLKQAGYSYIEDRRSGQSSFVRTLGRGRYPRFHMYVDEYDNGDLAFKIHLDQKQASYEGTTAHSGDYDEGPVLVEAERLKNFLSNQKAVGPKRSSNNPWAAFKK